MSAHFRSKLVLSLVSVVMIAATIAVPLSSSILHLHAASSQAAWNIVPSPNVGTTSHLNSVSVISATDVWAVGYSSTGTLIEHWDGTSWSIVSSPNPNG